MITINHFLITINDIYKTNAEEIVKILLRQKTWLFSSMPQQRALEEGDLVVVYIAGKGRQYFVANFEVEKRAEMTSGTLELGEIGKRLSGFAYQIKIRNEELWSESIKLQPLIDRLEFIQNKKYYGLSFRRAIRQITEKDYDLILNSRS